MHIPTAIRPLVRTGVAVWLACLVLGFSAAAQEKTDPKAGKPKPANPGETITNSIGMKLRWIAPGKALLALSSGERGKETPERTVEVEITRGYYLGVHEVTQEEYQQVMGKNPSAFAASGDYALRVAKMDTRRFPVDNVSRVHATDFCARLSALPAEKAAGRSYRLPTEAEWEHAARAGAKKASLFQTGGALSSKEANFNGNFPAGKGERGPYLERTAPVGSYPASANGLHDLHGNVWEWCQDRYERTLAVTAGQKDPTGPAKGEQHTLRGGSWLNRGSDCAFGSRIGAGAAEFYNNVGFRVVCDTTRPKE